MTSQWKDLASKASSLYQKVSDACKAGHFEEVDFASEQAEALLKLLIDAGYMLHRTVPTLALARANRGIALVALQRSDEALEFFRQAAASLECLVDGGESQFRYHLAVCWLNWATALSQLDRPEEAHDLNRQAARILRKQVEIGDKNRRRELVVTLINLGKDLTDLMRPDQALEVFEQAVAIVRELIGDGEAHYQLKLARVLIHTGNVLRALQRPEDSLSRYQEASRLFQTLADAGATDCNHDLGGALLNTGNTFTRLGRSQEALDWYARAVATFENLSGERQDLADLALAYRNWANGLQILDHLEEALTMLRKVTVIYKTLTDAGETQYRSDLANTWKQLGDILLHLERSHEAADCYLEAARCNRFQQMEARFSVIVPPAGS